MVNPNGSLLWKLYDEDFKREKDLKEQLERCDHAYLDFVSNSRNTNSKLSENKYLNIDLSHWNLKEKQFLFLDILQGIFYYYSSHTHKKDFDIKSYRSVKKAVKGENKIEIYEGSIKWFNNKTKDKLTSENYEFQDRDRMSSYL